MKNWSFQKRLMLWLWLLLVFLFGSFGVVEIRQISTIVDKKSVAELEAQASGVYSTLENSFFMNTAIQKEAVELASSFIEGRVALDYRRPLDVVVTNQVTKEESRVRIPSLLVDTVRVYRKPELIDKISFYTKTTVTIFQHIPKGLLRVATNIKKNDGRFAYGTYIPNSSPVYKKLMKGETYLGRAYVVNGWYITAYRPFKDKSGKVIGAIYTGLSEAKSLQLFLEKSRKALVGSSGHLFAFDSSGKFMLHPTQEGKAAPSISQKMIQEKNGSYKGLFINRNGDPVEAVMVVRYLEQMDWFIGATVTKDEYMADITHSKMFLGIGVLIALLVFLLFLKITTGRMFKGLNRSISERLLSVIDRADDIGKGNSDLLGRTQEQASALTESSSIVEEIVSTVEQTAQNAQNAYSLSQEVSMKASSSAEQSLEVEQAMGSIINSSSKIKDIVGLVEEIAFQTNILAINAAIEAAKAGDHGKGFAVVAVEVRELASRSSGAAKDIKELIGESLHNVEVGSGLVDESAKALQEIADQVLKVTDLIKEITSASKEEHVALQEINRALITIETNTQQNSSVADNANKNSSNMRRDARDLKEMIRGYMEWN